MMSQTNDTGNRDRQVWMAALAKARIDELEGVWCDLPDKPEFRFLRPPEAGLVMVQSRAGNTGRRFNLGEMTVTRCAVRINTGQTGVAYVAGRDFRHAELAAICDALLQDPSRRPGVERRVVNPLLAAQAERRRLSAAQTAATKVDFFTMVRGDD